MSSDPLTGQSLDTGSSDTDRSTTIRKPHFNFQSEEGLRVFIEQVVENGEVSINGEDLPANIIALTAEDGITNADGDPVTGSYAILPENEEGKSKL
mgnify:CR=1 FL=1